MLVGTIIFLRNFDVSCESAVEIKGVFLDRQIRVVLS